MDTTGDQDLDRPNQPSGIDAAFDEPSTVTPERAQRAGNMAGKAPVSLVLEFGRAIRGAARSLAEGARKYGRGDWKRGMPEDEVVDSLGRHLLAFMSGEMIDPDGGLPHVDKILSNAMMLSEYYHMRTEGITGQTAESIVQRTAEVRTQ